MNLKILVWMYWIIWIMVDIDLGKSFMLIHSEFLKKKAKIMGSLESIPLINNIILKLFLKNIVPYTLIKERSHKLRTY